MPKLGLVGHTGLVGSHILDSGESFETFNRSNIDQIHGQKFEKLYVSAMPAEKWKANKFPAQDLNSLNNLINSLSDVQAAKVILISTIDVFSKPLAVDELSVPEPDLANVYGSHRYALEKFIKDTFDDYSIIRLPGLVSPRLKKNILYDMKNENFESLKNVPINSRFQFYPLERINNDINRAISLAASIIHFAPEPLSVSEIVDFVGFDSTRFSPSQNNAPNYDFRTFRSELWNQQENNLYYMMTKQESLLAMQKYLSG